MNKIWKKCIDLTLVLLLSLTMYTSGYAGDSQTNFKSLVYNDISREYIDALHSIAEGKRKKMEGELLIVNSSRRRKIRFPYWRVFDNTNHQHNETVNWIESENY